jgi:hypothetical protein
MGRLGVEDPSRAFQPSLYASDSYGKAPANGS